MHSGRLPGLLKRFETKTLDIWKKHGIRPTGFWTVLIGDGNNDLHYMLAWECRARSASRSGMRSRPTRSGTRRATKAKRDGLFIANIKTSFLRPTAFLGDPVIGHDASNPALTAQRRPPWSGRA